MTTLLPPVWLLVSLTSGQNRFERRMLRIAAEMRKAGFPSMHDEEVGPRGSRCYSNALEGDPVYCRRLRDLARSLK